MMMKAYAFVRSNIPNVLNAKLNQTDTKELSSDIDDIETNKESNTNEYCPSFSNYLYFLFAPTLVYRDEYPR